MKKLAYSQVLKDGISKLDEAWSDAETFVFYSEKSGISESWIDKGLSLFPEEYIADHFVLLTSGSTGHPKMVIGSRKRAISLAKQIHRIQDNESVAATVVMLPLTYCYAFVNQYLWSKTFARSLILTRGFSEPDKVKTALSTVNEGMLCLVGAQIPLFGRHLGNTSFYGIKRLHFAGGAFPQNDMDVVRKLFPNARIFNNYGCAEAMPRLTIRPAEDSADPQNVGKPVSGIKMKSGVGDKIFFNSPYAAVAFYSDERFKVVRDEDWVPSGDIGKQLDSGEWWIAGRANELFKRFGEKVALNQLLASVCETWSGQATFYIENHGEGEKGHVLVLSPAPKEEMLRKILQIFRKNYSRAQWPVRIESVASLPMLPNGKVDKMALAKIDKKNLHWRQRL